MSDVLVKSFGEVDTMLQQKNIAAGSTALVALVDKKQLYLAWAGDSRALLIRDNKIVLETVDHKPHAPKEKERIESQGFTIIEGKDQGGNKLSRIVPDLLAMSRALGDHNYNCKKMGAMIATPEVVSTQIKEEDVLLLASDGLFDDLSNEKIVDIITTYQPETDTFLQKCITDPKQK